MLMPCKVNVPMWFGSPSGLVCKVRFVMRRLIRSFNIPRLFDTKGSHGGGEFEPLLGGMGNLNRKCQVFPVENT